MIIALPHRICLSTASGSRVARASATVDSWQVVGQRAVRRITGGCGIPIGPAATTKPADLVLDQARCS